MVISTECSDSDEKWKKSREMLQELKDDHMLKKLGPDRVLNYNVQWTSNGKCQRKKDHVRHCNKVYFSGAYEERIRHCTAL